MVIVCRQLITKFVETIRKKAHGEQAEQAWKSFESILMYKTIMYEIFYFVESSIDMLSG